LFFKSAKKTLAAWKALQDSERDSLYRGLKRHDVDCLQLADALDGVAQSGPVVVAHWPEANAKKRVFPRKNVCRNARDYLQAVKGKRASISWQDRAGGDTVDGDVKGALVANKGGRFVMAVVELVTGEPISDRELQEDLGARRKKRKMAGA
jgi:hypothetical protein